MSRTTVYVAPENGAFVEVAEFGNAWGSAARIWSALAERYCGDTAYWLVCRSEEEQRRFWALAKDERLSREERIVFAWTFDRALVDRPHFEEMARCLDTFRAIYPAGEKVCHLSLHAALLRRLASEDHGLSFAPFAVGIWQTSVSECSWIVREGEEGEDGEDCRPYDLSRDAGHWFLFEEIPE